MKKTIRYAAMILALGFAAACNKAEEGSAIDGQIRFAPESPATKAMVKDDTALQAATFQVYDYLDGEKYIDESITYGSGTWNYGSGESYTWKNGTHKLFGYRTDGLTTSFADNKVSFTHTLTTADAAQVDFLYSEVKTMTAAQWKATNPAKDDPVPRKFKHLFSALAMTVENNMGVALAINSISVNLPNSGTATVDFSGNSSSITMGELTNGEFIDGTVSASLASQAKLDVFGKAVLKAEASPSQRMVWPGTFAEGKVVVTLSYTPEGETAPITKEVNIVDNADAETKQAVWEAGKVKTYNLKIYPDKIVLTFEVKDWESVDNDLNTSTGSINMTNVTWQNTKLMVDGELVNTVVNSAYSVYMYHNPYYAVASKYTEVVYQTYEETVYQTYEEDVYDEDGVTILHHKGDQVLDENDNQIVLHEAGSQVLDKDGNPIVLHKVGDPVLDADGNQVYENGTQYSGYFPAQGYFTVNYPSSGKFKIGLIPAYDETKVEPEYYEIYIYNSTSKTWVPHNATEGEAISNETVYFQVRAAANQDGAQHKAQVDIWFLPAGSKKGEWISAYSEVRANYALVIPAVS